MRPPLAHQQLDARWPRPVPDALPSRDGHVVHLATHLDRGVLEFLGPAAEALARSGNEQTVVLIDHADGRSLLTGFADNADIVLVPLQRNPVTQWRALSAAFARAVLSQRPDAVHLHGLIAGVLGERVMAGLESTSPMLYSPHAGGVRGTLRPLAAIARLLGRSGGGSATARAIAHGTAEAEWLEGLGHQAVAVVEGPVDRAYFDVTQHAARQPLIVSASRAGDVRSAEAFDQLAVLLGGDALGLGFNWIGPVDAVSATRLKAAGVGVFDSARHDERADRLAAAWVFVGLAGKTGFPLCLAEAMATGLPCVALDTPAHRSLVRHGDTGYLCRSQAEVIDRIAQLADTPSLRERMGRAGRALARERFDQARFEHTLFAAYDAVSPAPEPATAPVPPARPVLVRQEGFGVGELP